MCIIYIVTIRTICTISTIVSFPTLLPVDTNRTICSRSNLVNKMRRGALVAGVGLGGPGGVGGLGGGHRLRL